MNLDKHFPNAQKPCWRKNGVWGHELPRCEKLKYVDHCRNCDVFESTAKKAISERTLGSGEYRGFLSVDALVEEQRLSGDQSVLPFRVGLHCFAVPSKSVVTIHDQIPVHSIPFNKSKVIQGVAAINHEVYTVISFTELLSISNKLTVSGHAPRRLYKRVLVVKIDSRSLAFYVDEVYPIFRYYLSSVNKSEKSVNFLELTKGCLTKEKEWFSDCYLLDLDATSNAFESSFL